MMKESEKMQNFKHPHVLNIVGVCVDAGPAPYIIMPFIANGSLLAYIRKEKTNLVVPKDADDELVSWQVDTICKTPEADQYFITFGQCYLWTLALCPLLAVLMLDKAW